MKSSRREGVILSLELARVSSILLRNTENTIAALLAVPEQIPTRGNYRSISEQDVGSSFWVDLSGIGGRFGPVRFTLMAAF
jgi:hypothetical protein